MRDVVVMDRYEETNTYCIQRIRSPGIMSPVCLLLSLVRQCRRSSENPRDTARAGHDSREVSRHHNTCRQDARGKDSTREGREKFSFFIFFFYESLSLASYFTESSRPIPRSNIMIRNASNAPRRLGFPSNH